MEADGEGMIGYLKVILEVCLEFPGISDRWDNGSHGVW